MFQLGELLLSFMPRLAPIVSMFTGGYLEMLHVKPGVAESFRLDYVFLVFLKSSFVTFAVLQSCLLTSVLISAKYDSISSLISLNIF